MRRLLLALGLLFAAGAAQAQTQLNSPIIFSTGLTVSGNTVTRSAMACADLTDDGTACTASTGTSGATLPFLNGTNLWGGTQTFGAVLGTVTNQSGTGAAAYTFAASDCGTMIRATGATAATYTVPATLPAGCHISVIQTTAAGQVTIAAGGGATFNANPHGYTKTFGQWAIISVATDTNSGGSAATFTIVGDGA